MREVREQEAYMQVESSQVKQGQDNNLVRKQYLVSSTNVEKIQSLLADKASSASSASEIIRRAIDAYDPQDADKMDSSELMSLVSDRLKDAIGATQNANKKVAATLKKLDQLEATN